MIDLNTHISTLKLKALVDDLTFDQKVKRSLGLLEQAHQRFGSSLLVANSLGKDSMVVWNLAKRVSADIKGFVVTTRFKPPETVHFMEQMVKRYPELRVFRNDAPMPAELHQTDPDRCCELLKVTPTRQAIEQMGAQCWVTGLRCTEGRTRGDFREQEQSNDLVKLNPILLWTEREIWQYLALYQVPVNPLYGAGYRSLGCAPCTRVSTGANERAGRWVGTSKCGGECGIHTRPLRAARQNVS